MSNYTKVKEILDSNLHQLNKIRWLTDLYFNGLNRETNDVYRIMAAIEELTTDAIKDLNAHQVFDLKDRRS